MTEQIDYFSGTTYICTDCGLDVERGIFNAAKHWEVCEHNAPNESIEAGQQNELRKKLREIENKQFDIIFRMMNEHEINLLLRYEMNGSYDARSNTIFMGSNAMQLLNDYKEKMKTKYSNK